MANSAPALLRLPDELLLTVLSQLRLADVLAAQLSCKRLSALLHDSYTLLWREVCLSTYQVWHQEHDIRRRLERPVNQTNWRALLARRKRTDRFVRTHLDGVIERQTDRISQSLRIIDKGCDANAILSEQINCPNNTPDVLARRYHAKNILGSINRTTALNEWQRLMENPAAVPLERALGAFDLFIAEVPPLNLDGIVERLDRIAKDFKAEHSNYTTMKTREKALALAAFMRSKGFTGVRSNNSFHTLGNNLIGVALCDRDHSALPLINAAIYSCVARRLGIDAQPCNFPFHILVIVTADEGYDLNGAALDPVDESLRDVMYLDPYRKALEVDRGHMLKQLEIMQADPHAKIAYMSPATNIELVTRTWRNMMQALQESQDYNTVLTEPCMDPGDPPIQPTTLSPHCAFYVSKWAPLYFGTPQDVPREMLRTVRARTLQGIVTDMQAHFLVDIHLIRTHILPFFTIGEHREALEDMVQHLLQEDSVPLIPQRRCEHDHSQGQSHEDLEAPPRCVNFKVGQLFRHRRYGYLAAVTGWDTSCKASDGWISQMNVDALPYGRDQSFYHVLVEDESSRYVAECNITPLSTEDNDVSKEALMRLAGKYFKRWDEENRSFVSNVRDQYPDD